MKIIKFGGTSVGEVPSIEQLCYILREKKKQYDRYIIIVSAIGGITDKLVNCAQHAEKKNDKYYLILDEIEIKHLEIIQELFPKIHKKKLYIE
jgi:aspartokinase/homoserine dehydrogenase 1